MNVRYFFIAGAITSGLTLSIQKYDRIVNQQPSPIVVPYTVEKTHLQFFKPLNNTLDSFNVLRIHNKIASKQLSIKDIYAKRKDLLRTIASFIGLSYILYQLVL
ncbi:hypothetical protein [Bartonella sp. TT121SHDZB]|uniref:hypothetical protein n=1 Tax=Bartonella sp. TT121SHDZB TaxID=3243580 RepID=UPI0035CEA0F8